MEVLIRLLNLLFKVGYLKLQLLLLSLHIGIGVLILSILVSLCLLNILILLFVLTQVVGGVKRGLFLLNIGLSVQIIISFVMHVVYEESFGIFLWPVQRNLWVAFVEYVSLLGEC